MLRHFLASLIVLPLFLICAYAAQNAPVDPPAQPWALFSSEESGTGSYLGVDINDITTERLSSLKLREEKGVEVTMVDQDAPAGKAGIKEHDVILTMNGTSVESKAQLQRMIHETPPGRVVTLGISRDGQPVAIKVQLGDRRKELASSYPKWKEFKDFHFEMPNIQVMPDVDIPPILVTVTVSARSGLLVENITPQLGEYFGVKNGNGVLVRSVEKGSRAEKAGFRAGDVIVKVNDQVIHDTSDFTHAVKGRSANSVNVGVMRDKKEQNLNLAMPPKDSSNMLQEESLGDEPVFQADTQIELSELKDEIAKVQPEMELAKQMVQENTHKAMDQARKSLCEAQKHLHEQSRKEREEMRKQEETLKKALEQMRLSARRLLADI